MRHVRIAGHNMKNLSSFKNQIGGILRELNKFDECEKKEALSYIRKYIDTDTPAVASSSSSNSYSDSNSKRKRATYNNKVTKKKRNSNKKKPFTSEKQTRSIIKYTNSENVSLAKIAFKCKVCSITEKTKRNMLKHLETHVGSPLSCLKCKKTFNGNVSFNWHLLHYCKSLFYDQWKFKCNQCSREFVSKRNLASHLQGHKRNNCTYCDKVLTRRVQLIRHLLDVHSVKLERETHSCTECDKTYIKRRNLYYHLGHQHFSDKFVCMECGRIDQTADDAHQHKLFHDSQKHFTCSRCQEKFSRRQQYLYHLKRHNRYKCTTCNESYASRAKVTRHKQLGHQVEGLNPRFICPHCPVAFQRETQFHIHMRKHTEEQRGINCRYCKKSFTSPYAYYKHCITINHEKFSPEFNNVACDKCDKQFMKRHELRQHIYRVHNETKQLVGCQYCDYKTVHKCNLERHVALHFRSKNNRRQFTCEHCGKSCDSLTSLKDHIAYNHVQERRFTCEKCSKSFKRNSELVRHKDSHSDERPHVCGVCDKSYKRLNHLKRHEKSAHKIVTETRKIKQVVIEEEQVEKLTPPPPLPLLQQQQQVVVELSSLHYGGGVSSSLLKNSNNDIMLNFSEGSDASNSGNIIEQITCPFVPDKGWNIDNEELYKVYNDAALNFAHQQQQQQIQDGCTAATGTTSEILTVTANVNNIK